MNCLRSLSSGLALAAATCAALATAETGTQRFEFRMPYRAGFHLEAEAKDTAAKADWIEALPEDGTTNVVQFGSRVVLELKSPDDLERLTEAGGLAVARVIRSNLFILQAPEAETAMREAHRLAGLPEVTASYPVLRRTGVLRGPYAQHSNDPFSVPYFYSGGGQRIDAQWYLENKDWNGSRLGVDLNVLAAWPTTAGQGVTVAIADTGVEMNHSELTNRLAGAPHFNFSRQWTNTSPYGGGQSDTYREFWTHGTSGAGLIAAERNNGRGLSGVAPQSRLAGWVIFMTNYSLVSDETLMDMYQYASNAVAVQNHSWGIGNSSQAQAGPTTLEQTGIANAVTFGRNGLGAVLVRAVGNDRSLLASASDDGYANDPQEIAVGAVTQTGVATEYSEPGACVLVAAPGGEGNGVNGKQCLVTLDLVGPYRGVNQMFYAGDLSDYRWGVQGFVGTSAAAPLVSGIAALILSANPNLGYRDVQQVLLLSARTWDLTDPDVVTNGAGLRVSHSLGYGVPDAGHAVWLARSWSNRPPLTCLTVTDSTPQPIPDDGLRVEILGAGIPSALASISCLTDFGPHADQPTPAVPLVDVGLATNTLGLSLTNKAALIARGGTNFDIKIQYAARAGAAFALVYNYAGDDSLVGMLNTELTTIPAVFLGNSHGEALKALFQTNTSALARIRLQSAERVFHVRSAMICEQVGVRVQTDHSRRGDLRITVQSPAGTRSVLQRLNNDSNPGPTDWTYWSTHHFLENSVGDWTVAVSDEASGSTGNVRSVSLVLRGTQILDSDHDGLDDVWELTRFGSLAYGAKDDPDGDGFCNAREQAMGTNPLAADVPFRIDMASWQLPGGSPFLRLSWPGNPACQYEVWGGADIARLSLITNLPGQFPEMEYLAPRGTGPQFYRVRSRSTP